MCPQNYSVNKMQKKINNKIKNESVHNLWQMLGTKLVFLVDFWDHIFKTVFPKQFFWFCILNSKMFRNMCKLRHKMHNSQKKFSKNAKIKKKKLFFSKWPLRQFRAFSKSLRPHKQDSFFQFFFTLYSRTSWNFCIWRHKSCNAKTGIGPTFTWSNEAWFSTLHCTLTIVL